jgi:hypothetical protein
MRLWFRRSVGEMYNRYVLICRTDYALMLRGDVWRSVSVHSTAMRCDALRRSRKFWLEVGGMVRCCGVEQWLITTTATITVNMPAHQPAYYIPRRDIGTAVLDDALGYQSLISMSMRRRAKLTLKYRRTKTHNTTQKNHTPRDSDFLSTRFARDPSSRNGSSTPHPYYRLSAPG